MKLHFQWSIGMTSAGGFCRFTFYVSAWTADQDTSSKKFSSELHQVLVDIRNLLDNGRASAAHL